MLVFTCCKVSSEDQINTNSNDIIKIYKFKSPVPEKYRYNISSKQGIRDNLSVIDIGGNEVSTNQRWHQGIDFALPDKTEVYASKDGYVVSCYPGYYNGQQWKGHPIYGGLIILNHYDGTLSLYAHLSLTKIKEGDYITQGQCIGWSGGVKGRRASGQSTGPHLHFSVYLNTDTIFD